MQLGSNSRIWNWIWIIGLSLAPGAGPAEAADQVWGFKGTVSSYTVGGGYISIGDLPVGSIVRGQVLFDDATADTDGSPTSGTYPYTAFGLALEGTSDLHLGVSALGSLGVRNDDPLGGGVFRDEMRLDTGGLPLVPSLAMAIAQLDFHVREDSPAPVVLTSDALPAVPPPLVDFTTEKLLKIIGYISSDVTDFDVAITEFGPVGTPDLPLIPDSVTVELDGTVTWAFSTLGVSLCVTGCWADPPAASGFVYRMTNAALFTEIADFPAGFGSAIEVSVGGSSVGFFGPGDSVDFTSYPGGGVAEFQVSGLATPAEVTSVEAFPLKLVFDSAGATFQMQSLLGQAVPFGFAPLVWGALAWVGVRSLRRH